MRIEKGNQISLEQLAERRKAIQRVEANFPTRVIDEYHSLDSINSLSIGGLGFVVTSNHFCRDDFQRTLAVLLKQGSLERKRVAIALGVHEFDTYEPFAIAAGIDVFPVTTQGTIDVLGNKTEALGTGMEEFMVGAVEALRQGNLVIMAPQGGRRPRLSRSEGKILQTLFGDTEDAGVEFGIIFTGIGIDGEGDYCNRNYHYGERFILRFSRAYRDKTLIAAIEGYDESQKVRKVDAFWEAQTRLLVPEPYR